MSVDRQLGFWVRLRISRLFEGEQVLTATSDPNRLAAASGGTASPELPELVFGADALTRGLQSMPRPYALITQPEPLSLLQHRLAVDLSAAAAVEIVSSLAEADLDQLERDLPPVQAVLGVGGGTAMDAAKFVAWQRAKPLYLAPSAVSVDACVTNTIAVRSGGTVEYRGFVVAAQVLVDFALIRGAPARMNRAGLGDLLSIHTALRDWQSGTANGGDRVIPSVAARAAEIFSSIAALAGEVFAVSPTGIEALVRAYLAVNQLCLEAGHAQAEEGSEHYFAYCLESVTGRSFIHGEAVTLGTVLMAELQHNAPDRIRSVADQAGVQWRPGDLGLRPGELSATLRRLPAFVREAGLPWSVINETRLDDATVRALAEAAR
jgi:glycerol-1-phosphate dehydrogenase [NAD(P)+]